MFIQTKTTPNPATLKFLPGQTVMEQGTADFPNVDSAKSSPLAMRLFTLEGVSGVFLGNDFVTVTKQESTDWEHVKPSILGAIMDHFQSGAPIIDGEQSENVHAAHSGEDTEIVGQIKELLDSRVRPAVAQDGGDITFKSFKEGVVTVELKGSCSGCPSSIEGPPRTQLQVRSRHTSPWVLGSCWADQEQTRRQWCHPQHRIFLLQNSA